MCGVTVTCVAWVTTAVWGTVGTAEEGERLPVVVRENFEQGVERWQPFDPAVWRVEESQGGHIYSQFKKQTAFQPPHRSPFLISLLDESVRDFELNVRVRSTHADYGHRDVCVVFGYQDPAHFYYVHLGKETDDHANQIFVVDDAPRMKISSKTTAGTPWDDEWHRVRIVRNTSTGAIAVYFDNMDVPVMTATDKRFQYGRIGLGSFDDTSAWDDLELRGRRHKPGE